MQEGKLQKIAEGREAEMFAWEEGTILRLHRDPEAQNRAQWEAAAMQAAADRGVRVPAVHGLTMAMGRPGVIMERIDGPDLLTLLGRRPWMVFPVGRICGEVHARIHATKASRRLPALRDTLRQWIGSSNRVPEHLAEYALEVLEELPDGDALCHGDFHPGNIMTSQGAPVVIDWTNATRGDPAADVGRTLILFRIGEPPPGSPALVRYLRLVGSKIVTSGYLRAYGRARPLDMAVVERWRFVQAAARLAFEHIPEEEQALRRLLEEGHAGLRRATSPGGRT